MYFGAAIGQIKIQEKSVAKFGSVHQSRKINLKLKFCVTTIKKVY